jgi:hypothetical protein
LRALPPLPAPLRLPQIGDQNLMTEEQTREALRRFINEQTALLGVDPQQLSLVSVTDQNPATHRALYQQRPFLYPLRGDLGTLEIEFTTDRRILRLSSTAIPDTEAVQRAIAELRPTSAEEIRQRIAGQQLFYTAPDGSQETVQIPPQAALNSLELVVYPITTAREKPSIELYLAWEVTIGRDPSHVVYLDAVSRTNKVLGVKWIK